MSRVLLVRSGARWMYCEILEWATVIEAGTRGGAVAGSAMLCLFRVGENVGNQPDKCSCLHTLHSHKLMYCSS